MYKIPTGEEQLVIDKMADYVNKNGLEFEDIIRAKKDARFEFLKDAHEYNKYYREKLRELMGEINKDVGNENKGEKSGKKKQVKEKILKESKATKKEKKVIGKLLIRIVFYYFYKNICLFFSAPVSFSIKKAKEDAPKEIKSALPVEESDDEEDEGSTQNSHVITPQAAVVSTSLSSILAKMIENQQKKETNEVVVNNKVENVIPVNNIIKVSSPKRNSLKKDIKTNEGVSKKNGMLLDVDDPLMEIIEQSGENGGGKKDSKRGKGFL